MLVIPSYHTYQHLDVIFAFLLQEKNLEPRDMVRPVSDAHLIERIEVLWPEFQIDFDVVKLVSVLLYLSVREFASLLLVQLHPFGMRARACSRHPC